MKKYVLRYKDKTQTNVRLWLIPIIAVTINWVIIVYE